MEHSTLVSVTAAYKQHGSLRKTAKALGVSHGVVFNILRGLEQYVNRSTENKVREAMGLDALPQVVEVLPCPICGQVHIGKHRVQKEVERWRDLSTSELSRLIRNRRVIT